MEMASRQKSGEGNGIQKAAGFDGDVQACTLEKVDGLEKLLLVQEAGWSRWWRAALRPVPYGFVDDVLERPGNDPPPGPPCGGHDFRSEEHTSELQSLMR